MLSFISGERHAAMKGSAIIFFFSSASIEFDWVFLSYHVPFLSIQVLPAGMCLYELVNLHAGVTFEPFFFGLMYWLYNGSVLVENLSNFHLLCCMFCL